MKRREVEPLSGMRKRFLEFLQKNKKSILNVVLALLVLILISVVSMLLLWAFDIIYFEDGMRINVELFNSFKSSWYGWIIIILVQIVLTILLCFVPAFSMAFIMLVQALYEQPWQAFIITFTAVMLTSLVMYLMGRYGGYRLCKRLLGEKDCEKASELLNHKGVVFFPLMMLFPIFPDDALVMIAGTLRMSLKWFIPSIVIGRGVGIVTIVFGLGSVPFERFNTPWHWISFLVACALFLAVVFFCAFKLNSFIEKRDRKQNDK